MTDRQFHTQKTLINILFLGRRVRDGSEANLVVVDPEYFEPCSKVRGIKEEFVQELVCGHWPDDCPFDIVRVPPQPVLGARG